MVVAVFYGGKSCEHDVSVITGVQAAKYAAGHEVIPVYIQRDGRWIIPKKYDDISLYRLGAVKGKPVCMHPSDAHLYTTGGRRLKKIDVALLCTHGAGGEDGALQGLLQLSGVAYTGSGIAASAAGMDKRVMKRLFSAAGLPVLDYVEAERAEYERELLKLVERCGALGFPLVVKPASLGSSIGITVAHDPKQLICALNLAFEWDNAVVVEKGLTDFTELNCAVIGRGERTAVSYPEKPLGAGEILSYADKYERGGLKGAGLGREFPAKIDAELTRLVRLTAAKAFSAIGAGGIARVDFLFDNETEKLFVNEINTIPGSLALYLFPMRPDFTDLGELEKGKPPLDTVMTSGAKSGVGSAETLNELLRLAVEEKKERDRLRYRYTSPTAHGKGKI